MTTDDDSAPRPRPSRPSVRVTPLREPVPDTRPRAVDAATGLWALCLIVLLGTAALIALDLSGVRDRLSAALSNDAPDTSTDDIDATVMIILAAGAAVSAVVVLVALAGILQVRGRRTAGRSTMVVIGVIAAAGAVAFRLATVDAVTGPALWLPFAVAVLAVLGTAVLFAPGVGSWLDAAPVRR